MKNYQGEYDLDISDSEYKDYKTNDWVLHWIEMYGSIDGDHHKAWLIDQIARIIHGVRVVIKIAKWDGHQEERFYLSDVVTLEYASWVEEMKNGEDGPNTYSYNEGIAP